MRDPPELLKNACLGGKLARQIQGKAVSTPLTLFVYDVPMRYIAVETAVFNRRGGWRRFVMAPFVGVLVSFRLAPRCRQSAGGAFRFCS